MLYKNNMKYGKLFNIDGIVFFTMCIVTYNNTILIESRFFGVKVVRHIEMPKAAPQKFICHFQKLEMILRWNKQNTVRLPQKYQFY